MLVEEGRLGHGRQYPAVRTRRPAAAAGGGRHAQQRQHSPGASKMPPPGTGAGAQHIEAYFPSVSDADVDAVPHPRTAGSRESPVVGALFATPTPILASMTS